MIVLQRTYGNADVIKTQATSSSGTADGDARGRPSPRATSRATGQRRAAGHPRVLPALPSEASPLSPPHHPLNAPTPAVAPQTATHPLRTRTRLPTAKCRGRPMLRPPTRATHGRWAATRRHRRCSQGRRPRQRVRPHRQCRPGAEAAGVQRGWRRLRSWRWWPWWRWRRRRPL